MRPVHGGCWWALAAAVIASIVSASPAAAETTLQIDAGYAGSFVAGQEVPVRVRVSADRLMRGTLEVGIGNLENGVPVAMPVEVPGGSQKEFLLVAPSSFNQSPDVVARLLQGDQLVASGQVTVRSTPDTELVGILPGALRGRPVPGPTTLAVDAGTARFAAIGPAELEQAPASLGPLSTLVADIDEISRLSPGARAGVLQWMEAGGRLLVDSARGQTVPGLPDGWQPGTRGRAPAGLGEVVATGGAVAAGRWAGLIEPSGRGVVSAEFGEGAGMPLASSLASDAGLRTPEIAWLVGFLVAYVVVVGPVVFFAVRRSGRPELAWVAVPLVALLFTSGSWAVGRNLRTATELVHASVLTTGAGGPVASSYVGVFSRSGETARVGFPAGWSTGSFTDVGGAATPSLVTYTAGGPEARLALDIGQFGMVYATGPAAGDLAGGGGLQVTATMDADGRVAGSVRNSTGLQLDGVALFAGSNATAVGELGPGDERAFSVVTGQPRMDGRNQEFMVWGGLGIGGPDGVADFALWQIAKATGGVNLLSPGAVVAAGWTRDFVPDVRVGGRDAEPEGRTVVLGRAEVRPPATGPGVTVARRDIVRDPFGHRFAGPPRGGGSVVRFVFPEGADTSNLTMTNLFGSAEIWQDGAWQPATCTGANCQGPEMRAVPNCPPGVPCPPMRGPFRPDMHLTVPPAGVRDGILYVRVPGPASIDQRVPLTIGRSA